MRLVIFDFCDTITNFQTANEFCKFVLKKEKRRALLLVDQLFEVGFLYRIFTKLGLKGVLSKKKLLLSGLKGIKKGQLDSYGLDYVEQVIEKNRNQVVYFRFLEHLENGDRVVINSGGYEPYLKQFADKYNVKYCYSTQFDYCRDVFNGSMNGRDCLGIEKVNKMKQTGLLNQTYSEVFVYSDSKTDMPIFNLATRKIAVIKQSNVPDWCSSDFEIIRI